MPQNQNTIVDKSTGDPLTAAEFNELKDQANSNATDAEGRISSASGGYEFTGGFTDRSTGQSGANDLGSNINYKHSVRQ